MVEQLRLEICSRPAQDFYIFKHAHKPAPESPDCRDQEEQNEQGGPRPARDSAVAAGGLKGIGSASTGAYWRRGTWRCIGRMRAADRAR
jgi:hypothetical protein